MMVSLQGHRALRQTLPGGRRLYTMPNPLNPPKEVVPNKAPPGPKTTPLAGYDPNTPWKEPRVLNNQLSCERLSSKAVPCAANDWKVVPRRLPPASRSEEHTSE